MFKKKRTYEFDSRTGAIIGRVEGLHSVIVAEGASKEAVDAALLPLIKDYEDDCRKRRLTAWEKDQARIMVRLPRELDRAIRARAKGEKKSVNAWAVGLMRAAVTR